MSGSTEAELNQSLTFPSLKPAFQHSFTERPQTIHMRFPPGFQVYKWTEYPFLRNGGGVTEFWCPWQRMMLGNIEVPGFKELRMRYRNIGGSVGRPQEFARVRNAVTNEWNAMSSLTKAELRLPVWGFIGVCSNQLVSTAQEKERPSGAPPTAKVVFLGGDYQLLLPNMTAEHIFKL